MSNVKRYSLPIVLAALAAALLVLGILAVTVWRPPQQVVASRDADEPFVMTRAGVLPLYADEVTVRATGEPDQTVWLAVGSPEDVTAWLQDEPYDEIVGLVGDINTLKSVDHPDEDAQSGAQSGEDSADVEVEAQSGAQSGGELVNPISSDMWSSIKYGKGSVSTTLSGSDMDSSILAATDGSGPGPRVTLEWNTPQSNLLAVVAFVSAGVVAAIAAVIALALYGTRNRRLARSQHLRGTEERATLETAELEALPPTAGQKRPSRMDRHRNKPAAPALAPEQASDAAEGVPDGDVSPTQSKEVQEREVPDKEPQAAEPEGAAGVTEPEPEGQEGGEPEAPESPQESQEPEEGDAEEAAEPRAEVEQPAEVEQAPSSVEAAEGEGTAEQSAEAQKLAARSETVTTDSGMMNLSALQGGGAFPTRRALRDARRRGVDKLVVGDRAFQTTSKAKDASDPTDALEKSAVSPEKWSEAMGSSGQEGSSQS